MAKNDDIKDSRIVDGAPKDNRGEDGADTALRPERLKDFTGQVRVCENLAVFVAAAAGPRRRHESPRIEYLAVITC